MDLGAGHPALRVVAPDRDGGTDACRLSEAARPARPAAVPRARQRLVLLHAELGDAGVIRPGPAEHALAPDPIPPDGRGDQPLNGCYSFPIIEREWRADLQPRYRAAVERAEGRVETLEVAELPAFIDELADLAGELFTAVTALAGAAYKMEAN